MTEAERVVVRRGHGRYEPVSMHPRVGEVRSALRRARRLDPDASLCLPTNLHSTFAEARRTRSEKGSVQGILDAVAALACRRSGLQYKTVRELLTIQTRCDDPLLHKELIRAWAESGIWDVVRQQDRSATFIVPRRPRFVAFLRGPDVEATLVGLLTSPKARRLQHILDHRGVWTEFLDAPSPWQSELVRIRCEPGELEEISTSAGLQPIEWIRWDDSTSVPAHLDTSPSAQGLGDDPPVAFGLDATWDWARRVFSRVPAAPGSSGVRVERRSHSRRCSIYVVLVDQKPWAWTYIENWALLVAYALRGEPPFVFKENGVLHTSGASPVHLPLPWGRLCAMLGQGVPGPTIDGSSRRVVGYRYPFGPRLVPLIEKSLPTDWLVTRMT